MKQKVIKSMEGLLEQAAEAISGAAEFGAALSLANSEAAITTDRTGFANALGVWKTGKTTLKTKREVVRSITATARKFAKTTRGVLEETLGSKPSPEWEEVGFAQGTLSIPRSTRGIQVLLEAMAPWLTAHPDDQNEDLEVTPERASGLATDINTAKGAVNTQRTSLKQLMIARDAAKSQLRKRLRDLTLELRQKLDPLDPRWLSFGLNMPGAKNIPSVPENVTAVLVGETAASVKWDASERAEYYRVWKRVVGVDTEFVSAGSPVDRDFTIEGLPRNATIELVISAVNNGGESGKSTVVTVVTH